MKAKALPVLDCACASLRRAARAVTQNVRGRAPRHRAARHAVHAAASAPADGNEPPPPLPRDVGRVTGARRHDAQSLAPSARARGLDPRRRREQPARGVLDPYARGPATARPCAARVAAGSSAAARRPQTQALDVVGRGPGQSRGGCPGHSLTGHPHLSRLRRNLMSPEPTMHCPLFHRNCRWGSP